MAGGRGGCRAGGGGRGMMGHAERAAQFHGSGVWQSSSGVPAGAVPDGDGCHDPVGGVGGCDRASLLRRFPGQAGPQGQAGGDDAADVPAAGVVQPLDEGVEDAIYDSYAMRRFMGLDFAVEQVPDATTLLHFRHLLEEHTLGEKLLAEQNRIFEAQGWIMRGGSTCPGMAPLALACVLTRARGPGRRSGWLPRTGARGGGCRPHRTACRQRPCR